MYNRKIAKLQHLGLALFLAATLPLNAQAGVTPFATTNPDAVTKFAAWWTGLLSKLYSATGIKGDEEGGSVDPETGDPLP
ncbi:hypothetical protein [Pseudomarimonas arenosa]|uniref:Uncharacterized protein n=1 Tax=Pseudomarimonas arenosa TaxID=2774145 RepID=A0AAW3ZEY6_9GAMM|nr:hypothetical protein [Pseudomarimonas arenosa]MBD8524698.1 hypothetical protein [Pseudomarimonas arenosa]